MTDAQASPDAYHVLNTRSGDLVDEFSSRDEALSWLATLAAKHPDEATAYAMFPVDAQGHSVGPGVLGSEALP